jgi:alpha/beta superfamily hydrolase
LNPTYVTFPCGELKLEAAWHHPDGMGPFPGVVVCHPHPLHGGDMSNNVISAICETLAKHSIAALRFNFRGVGNSEGEFGGGYQEQDDIAAALTFHPHQASMLRKSGWRGIHSAQG